MKSGVVRVAVAAALLSLLAAGLFVGPNLVLLVLAAWCLFGVISTLWHSVQNLSATGEVTLEDALHLGMPNAVEQRKQAVLRALKDLEYERSVGKIGREDYLELSQHYRAQARELIHELDKSIEPARRAVEQRIAKHLSGAATTPNQLAAPAANQDANDSTASPLCPSCATPNDPDARFCKRCGVALSSTESPAAAIASKKASEPADTDAAQGSARSTTPGAPEEVVG